MGKRTANNLAPLGFGFGASGTCAKLAVWLAAILCGALATAAAGPDEGNPAVTVAPVGVQAAAEVEPASRSVDALSSSATERQGLGRPEPESRPIAATGDGRKGDAADAFRTMAVLGGVIAIILGLAIGVRVLARRQGGLLAACGPGGKSPAGVLSVLGRYPIARGQSLLLLQLDRRVILVAQAAGRGGSRLTTLSEVTDPEEVASILVKTRDESGESVAQKFREIVERVSKSSSASEQAVTVVAPVERGDWFEKTGSKRAKPAAATPNRAEDMGGMGQVRTRGAARVQKVDGAAALRLRLDALRAGASR